MSARRALLTGATGAIGGAIAEGLAREGFEVHLVARDPGKAARRRAELERRVPGARLHTALCDLSRHREIERLAHDIREPVHVLVNNAALAPRRRSETPDGIEMQWAVNVLSYYWMTEAFLPQLTAAGAARVVNVASYWAGGLELDDVEWKRRSYDNDAAYRQSKQADRMLSRGMATELAERAITVNSCHPGDVESKLASDLGFGGHERPSDGARTPLWLATSDEVSGASGGYYANERRQECRFSKDAGAVGRLLALCAGY